MNTNDLTIFLVSIVAFACGLAITVYYIFNFLRAGASADRDLAVNRHSERANKPVSMRRRAVSYPGIICALPMHQVKRADAPMTDIWTR